MYTQTHTHTIACASSACHMRHQVLWPERIHPTQTHRRRCYFYPRNKSALRRTSSDVIIFMPSFLHVAAATTAHWHRFATYRRCSSIALAHHMSTYHGNEQWRPLHEETEIEMKNFWVNYKRTHERCAHTVQIPLATEPRCVLWQHRSQTKRIDSVVVAFFERPKNQFSHFNHWANSACTARMHGRRPRRRQCWCDWPDNAASVAINTIPMK